MFDLLVQVQDHSSSNLYLLNYCFVQAQSLIMPFLVKLIAFMRHDGHLGDGPSMGHDDHIIKLLACMGHDGHLVHDGHLGDGPSMGHDGHMILIVPFLELGLRQSQLGSVGVLVA